MKNLKNLGKALSKAEQKSINGGHLCFEVAGLTCQTDSDCCGSFVCKSGLGYHVEEGDHYPTGTFIQGYCDAP